MSFVGLSNNKRRVRILIKFGVLIFSAFTVSYAANTTATLVEWAKERNDTVKGANITKAFGYLTYKGLSPATTTVVAVLDSGIDTTSVALKKFLWVNPEESINGVDDDKNGYIDDVNGWNFLGTADGSFNMTSAGTEEYREFKRLYPKYKDEHVAVADSVEYEYYVRMRQKAGIRSYLRFYEYNTQKYRIVSSIDSIIKVSPAVNVDTLKFSSVPSLEIADTSFNTLVSVLTVDLLKSSAGTKWNDYVKSQADELTLMRNRINGIEHDKDKRLLMADDMQDYNDIYYGNNTLMAEGCEHGNFVASVIAGECGNYKGIGNGFTKLMIVRCAPDGDEYDKDVSSAIKYAVNNGAKVINLSLGKYTSPNAKDVNAAIAYAGEHDVLIVAAAGNNHRDIDSIPYFPTAVDANGRHYGNYIRIGASDINGKISKISNFGAKNVDIYAPGENILGIYPGDKVDRADGTSVATPIVSGIAAMLRSYFPALTAADVKEILIASAYRPVGADYGIVDALSAVTMANERVAANRVKAQDKISEVYTELSSTPQWIDGSNYVYYSKPENGVNCYYIVDARSGKSEPLIRNVDKFIKDYTAISGDTSVTPRSLRLYGIKLVDNSPNRFSWSRRGKEMVYDRKKGKLSLATKSDDKQSHGGRFISEMRTTTADSLYTMLGDRYNLYVRNNSTGALKQLTFDGKELDSYCYKSGRDSVSEKNPSGSWRGHVYLCTIYDDSEVGDLYLIDAVDSRRPKLTTKKMPLPNEKGVRRFKIYRYNADTDEGGLLPIDKFVDQNVAIDYYKSDEELYFVRRSRSVDSLELCRLDIPSGDIKVIISEVSKPHFNVTGFNYRIINGGNNILWWSERTGKGNYYLYDKSGKLLNRVTNGDDIVVGNVEKLDSVGQSIIFSAHTSVDGSDPCYTYYYKVKLDGTGQKLLTKGVGTHKITLSSDGKYAIDTYSRMDMPPVHQIVNISAPDKSYEFYRMSDAPLREAGWTAPELFTVKAADDSTNLYGIMYRPYNFDESKHYPIISNVYPGPQDDQIQRSFAINDNANQALADMGFIVINVAPRGSSPWRGHDFYCYSYGNLRDYPIADDRHAIEQLAERYTFIDLNRVGIYGHSGGGAMTVTAMLTYPDFYKVGVAASGNHDNNIYIQWWGETFHGLTKLGGIPTNAELAGNLNGRLLLISGDVDDNVPYASTLRFADALIKNNKQFDMMILPGKDHGLGGAYYEKLIRDYFINHLLNL